ncbi:MAG: ribonuclease R, partial [Pseudomonadota bacterium]
GRISGVQRFGIFVSLDDTGADGLVPVRAIGHEFFRFDANGQSLMGEDSGLLLSMGLPVTVRLSSAEPLTGGLMLELLEVDGKALPQAKHRSRRAGPRRIASKSKRRADKGKRKVTRKSR